ncbi:MAG: hypothetical protein AAF799_24235 [Myxococcota bacterium]
MGLGAVLGWALASPVAFVTPPEIPPTSVELRWETVPSCPSRQRVREELGALLGPAAPAEARAHGTLRGREGAYALQLEIEVGERREQRQLEAADCTLLTRAGVLVIAVTVDALAVRATLEPPPVQAPKGLVRPTPTEPTTTDQAEVPAAFAAPPAEDSAPEPRSAAAAPLGPAPTNDAKPPTHGTLGASAGLAWGLNPALAAGVSGEFGLERGPLQLLVAGYHWFSRSTPQSAQTGVEAALSGGLLRGCFVWSRARFRFPLCGGIDLAAMHGGGVGTAVRRLDVVDLWAAVSAGAGLRVSVSPRFALMARVETSFALRRPAMALLDAETSTTTFRMPEVGVRLTTGPIFRLW